MEFAGRKRKSRAGSINSHEVAYGATHELAGRKNKEMIAGAILGAVGNVLDNLFGLGVSKKHKRVSERSSRKMSRKSSRKVSRKSSRKVSRKVSRKRSRKPTKKPVHRRMSGGISRELLD